MQSFAFQKHKALHKENVLPPELATKAMTNMSISYYLVKSNRHSASTKRSERQEKKEKSLLGTEGVSSLDNTYVEPIPNSLLIHGLDKTFVFSLAYSNLWTQNNFRTKPEGYMCKISIADPCVAKGFKGKTQNSQSGCKPAFSISHAKLGVLLFFFLYY